MEPEIEKRTKIEPDEDNEQLEDDIGPLLADKPLSKILNQSLKMNLFQINYPPHIITRGV